MLTFIAAAVLSSGGANAPTERVYPLASAKGLEVVDAAVGTAVYRGKRAVVLTEELDPDFGDVAIVKGVDFHNGTIEFDVAGLLSVNAPKDARSFVGIAFRGTGDMRRYENFYLRMTNGRSPSQELRNHAVQYCSVPNYPWDLLRAKRPFRYEAYTDLELGAWTHVKVWVHGTEAQFFVGNVTQPTLIVHGLLMGDTHGKVALWIDGYTKGYFANLRIRAS